MGSHAERARKLAAEVRRRETRRPRERGHVELLAIAGVHEVLRAKEVAGWGDVLQRPEYRCSEAPGESTEVRTLLVLLYRPGMAAIPQSVRDLLATGPLVHVVTLDPDGTPHVTLAWAGVEGDEVVMATFYNLDQPKLRNLRRDPRVVLSAHAKEHTGAGLHPYVVIQGRARLSDGGALELMDRLAEAYIGAGQSYPMRDVPDGAVVHVTVDRIYGQGPWRSEARGR